MTNPTPQNDEDDGEPIEDDQPRRIKIKGANYETAHDYADCVNPSTLAIDATNPRKLIRPPALSSKP